MTRQMEAVYAAAQRIGRKESEEEFAVLEDQRLLLVSEDWLEGQDERTQAEFALVRPLVLANFGRKVLVWQLSEDWGGGKSVEEEGGG